MRKRGQLSIFIVFGLILLFGLLFFLFQDRLIKSEVVETSILPQEILPVKDFIESCVAQVGEESVIRLGEQGGYLYYPSFIANDPLASISPNGFTSVPYWYLFGQNRVPELLDMEEDLSKYMNDRLPVCLRNFEDFKNQFKVTELSPISTLVSIANEEVDYDIEYTLKIEKLRAEDEYFLKTFKVGIPARLKRVYEFARLILEAENEKMFLENITLDLMAADPRVPFTGLEFACAEKTWYLPEVREQVGKTLQSQLPLIRFKNSRHRPFQEVPEAYQRLADLTIEDIWRGERPENVPDDAYQYFHYFIDISNRDFSDLSARVDYNPEWGLDMQARPSDGGLMRATSGEGDKEFLRFLCFQFYHFTYDVQYPVLISVRDDLSFGGDGLVMKFSTPVQLIHNAPDRRDRGSNFFYTTGGGGNYCDGGGPEVDIRAKGRVDEFTNVDIKGVNISYDCFKYRCELGQTVADGGIYRARANLPSGCSGGYLIAEKEGYLRTRKQLEASRTDIEMKKLQKIQVDVRKHQSTSLRTPRLLDSWDSAVISLYDRESDYRIFADLGVNKSSQLEFIYEDTTYEAEMFLIDNLDETLYGGFRGNVTISKDMLNSEQVVFHVLEQVPKPFGLTAGAEMIRFLNEDTEYKTLLQPTSEGNR